MVSSLLLDGPSRPPQSGGDADSVVVFLHGYGADGNDLISLSPFFARSLPGAAFHALNGPEPCEMNAMGRQWFSLALYDPNLMRRDPVSAGAAFAAMYDGVTKSVPPLIATLEGLLAHYRLSPDRMALIGFSQGTMMALHVGLRREKALGAVVGFSGAIVGASHLATELGAPPPILLVHGEADPVVPIEALNGIEKTLTDLDVSYEALRIPGLQHGIDQTGAEKAAGFLATHLAPPA